MTKAANDVLEGRQALSKRPAERVKRRNVGLLDMFQLADMCKCQSVLRTTSAMSKRELLGRPLALAPLDSQTQQIGINCPKTLERQRRLAPSHSIQTV